MTMSLSASQPEERSNSIIKRMTTLQNQIVDYILVLSKDEVYQDATIVCQNGTFQSNSLALATIFPVLRNVLASSPESNSEVVIFIPDMDVTELEIFFESLYLNSSIINTTSMIQRLLLSASFSNGLFSDKYENKLPEKNSSKIQNPRPIQPKINENFQIPLMVENVGYLSEQEDDDMNEENLDFSVLDPDVDTNFKENDIKTEIKNEAESKVAGFVHDHDSSEIVNIGILKKGKDFDDPVLKETHNSFGKKWNKKAVKRHRKVTFDQYLVLDSQSKKCSLCDYTSKVLSNVRRHFERIHMPIKHSSVEKISCHICGKKYTSYSLEKHIRVYHSSPAGQTKCVKCLLNIDNEKFPNHICQKLPCPSCNQMFRNQTTLSHHMKTIHEYHPDSVYCSECGRGFPSKSKLTLHMRTHKEKQTCSVCGAMVKELEVHMKLRHPKEEDKNFKCPECDKRFVTTHCMEKHRMSVHLKLRPYNCRYGCEFAYNDSSNRNAHEKKTHGKLFITATEERERYKESLRAQAEKL